MNFMPRPKEELLSQLKEQLLPEDVYFITLTKEEDRVVEGIAYKKIWFDAKNLDSGLVTYNKSGTLRNNNKISGFRLYKYFTATGRDYRSGQLKNIVGDQLYAHIGQYTSDWIDKEGKKRTTIKNYVKDFLCDHEIENCRNYLKIKKSNTPAKDPGCSDKEIDDLAAELSDAEKDNEELPF